MRTSEAGGELHTSVYPTAVPSTVAGTAPALLKRHLRDVPDDVRQSLELIPVTRLEEVLAHAFPGGYNFQVDKNEMASQRMSTAAAAARGLKQPVMHRSGL